MREQILVEATDLFSRYGYDGTSLNDIAAGVGIKRPSLLHHFPSKDDLYGEVFERILSDWLGKVEEALAVPAEGWDRFSHVVRAGLDLFGENPAYVRLIRREALEGGERLGIDLVGVISPLFDAAVRWMENEMVEGRFRSVDARHVLVTAYTTLLGYVSDAPFITGLLAADPLHDESLAARCEHLLDMFHRVLVPSTVEPHAYELSSLGN